MSILPMPNHPNSRVGSEIIVADEGAPRTSKVVFISYSRVDLAFVDTLTRRLEQRHVEVLIDRKNIEKGERFFERIKELIVSSDVMVFVVSSSAVQSSICGEELLFAARIGRRILPLIWHAPDSVLPSLLAETNWVSAESYRLSSMTDERALTTVLDELENAINLDDLQWVRAQSNWARRALAWDLNSRRPGALLPAVDLEAAQAWLGRRPAASVPVPALLLEFIQESAKHQTQLLRRGRRVRMAISGLIVMAGVLVVLGAAATTGLMSRINSRTSRTLSVLAERAFDAGNFESASRYALAAMNGYDALAMGYDASRPQTILRAAIMSNRRVHVIFTHGGEIKALARSPDGKLIAVASSDKSANVWIASTGQAVISMSMNDPESYERSNHFEQAAEDANEIASLVEFSPNGSVLLGAYGSCAFLWSLETHTLLHKVCHLDRMESDLTAISAAHFSPDGKTFLTASLDSTVRIWSVASGSQLRLFQVGNDYVRSARFSPDGRYIIATSNGGIAVILSVESGKRLTDFRQHKGRVFAGAFSPDGTRVVTASDDNTVRVWDPMTGHQFAVLWHSGFVYTAEYSKDGHYVVTTSADGNARLWNSATGELLVTYAGHSGPVVSATFSCGAHQLLTSSADGTARIWDVSTGTLLNIFAGAAGRLSDAIFNPDCSRVITAGEDQAVRFWSTNVNTPLLSYSGTPSSSNKNATISPDHNRVVIAGRGSASLIDTTARRAVATLDNGRADITIVAFSPDSLLVLTGGNDGNVRLWSAHDGKPIAVLRPGIERVIDASFSSDSKALLVLGDDGNISVWDVATKSVKKQWIDRGISSFNAAFVFSTTRLIVCCSGPTHHTRLYDALSGRLISEVAGMPATEASATRTRNGPSLFVTYLSDFEVHDANTGAMIQKIGKNVDTSTVTYSSDDGLILAVILDEPEELELWRTSDGVRLWTLPLLGGNINALAFVPGSMRALASMSNGLIYMIDLEAGFASVVFRGHTGPTTSVSVSNEGRFALSAGMDGSSKLWSLPHEARSGRQLITAACQDLLAFRGNVNIGTSFARLTKDELQSAPSVDATKDFKTEGNVCAPVSPWMRLLDPLRTKVN